MSDEGPTTDSNGAKGRRSRVRERLLEAVNCLGRAATWLHSQFRRYWLGIAAVALAIILSSIIKVAIDIGSRPARGTTELVQQITMFVAVVQAVMAYAVAMAALYQAQRSGRMTALEERRTTEAKREKRREVVHALLGAAMESAAYAGWLVELQRRNPSWQQILKKESAAEQALAVEGWKQLSSAVARVCVAMERVRLETPDLVDPSWPLFDSAVAALELATKGDANGLAGQAEAIRDQASALRLATLAV